MSSGYLIPADPSPENYRCLRVYAPDDPLYMAALLGALTYMGQWTAWERDELHRGTLAANSWKVANELTMDGLSVPCGDNPITDEEMNQILEQLEDIRNQLEELNQMNVTVTQTVNGCGCGGDETVATTNTTDGIILDPDETGVIPTYATDTVGTADSARCRVANWMALLVVQTVRTMSTIGTMPMTLSNVVGVLVSIFTIGNGLIWSMTAILALGYRVVNSLASDSFDYFDTVADVMESGMESLVCALYDWTSAENLGAQLNGKIYEFVAGAKSQVGMSDAVADAVYTVLVDVMGAAFVNYIVDNVDAVVPAGFVPQYDCLCGATGDSCPASNLVLAGVGTLPSGDISGTEQAFASQFNSDTGFHEVVFELANNYCVTVDSAEYSPTEMHETCSDGVMVASDGSCVRRFVARSLAPFATVVTFKSVTVDCRCLDFSCLDPSAEIVSLSEPPTFLSSGCPNVIVDSLSVVGDRVTVNFHSTAPACTTAIWTLKMPVMPGVYAYTFDDLQLVSPTAIKMGSLNLAGDTSGDYYDSFYTDWDDCLASQLYTNIEGLVNASDGHEIHFTVNGVSGTPMYYTLSATIKAVRLT